MLPPLARILLLSAFANFPAATMYYVTNVRAALTLSDPMFYSKIAWVGRYFDSGGGFGGAGGEVVDCTRGGPREPNRGFEK